MDDKYFEYEELFFGNLIAVGLDRGWSRKELDVLMCDIVHKSAVTDPEVSRRLYLDHWIAKHWGDAREAF